jgi:two-component system response regulator YesN
MAFRVFGIAKKCGIDIPREIGLTGIDGIVAQEGNVSLTTVGYDTELLAKAAVKLLMQAMSSRRMMPQQQILISSKLIKGESGSRKMVTQFSKNKNEATLLEMQEILLRHLTDGSPTLYLSQRWGVGKIHIQRLFKKYSGESCLQYVQKKRIEKASQLLKTKNKKISFIAQEIGFSSLRTFNRLFKKQLGHTPLEWRERFHS